MDMRTDVSHFLHQGLENHDVETLMSLYDDDAELLLIDQNHPPSMPRCLYGKEEISDYFKDVLGRSVTHHIEEEVMAHNHLAYTDNCEYPDGSRVFTSSMATMKNGKIVREVDVQAWDEVSPYVKLSED